MHISTQSSITSATSVVPEMSYSSSEDEDFFDADEGLETPGRYANGGNSIITAENLNLIVKRCI